MIQNPNPSLLRTYLLVGLVYVLWIVVSVPADHLRDRFERLSRDAPISIEPAAIATLFVLVTTVAWPLRIFRAWQRRR